MILHFLVPGNINTLTGGYVYDKYIIEGLRKLGYSVILHELANDFPFPSFNSLNICKSIVNSIPAEELILIDSLAFGPMHEILAQLNSKNILIVIMHLPLSKNPNFSHTEQDRFFFQEKKALYLANRMVAVSEFTKQLIVGYGIEASKIAVITPGVKEASRKTIYPETPEKLLCVGSYLPGKGQLLLVQALAELKDLPWTLTIFGIQDFDTTYLRKVKQKIKSAYLTDRIFVNPPVSGEELDSAYLNADLFILPSYFENFSMALNDALNFGLPVITTDGGGIPSSVPHDMGIFVPVGNKKQLKQAIKNVITDSLLYKNLYSAAAQYYKSANTWENSINQFHSLIQTIGPGKS